MKQIRLLLLLLLIELCVAQVINTCQRKAKCKNKGGQCQPKGTLCAGKIWKGNKFCREWKDCDCCVPPPDCRKGTKQSCKILKGTCMHQKDICNGTAVIHKDFCKSPDTCKCCFKDCVCDPVSCTYNNQDGRCSRHLLPGTKNVGPQECKNGCECYIADEDNNCENERKCSRPDAESEGYYPTGHCRKECHGDEEPWDKCDTKSEGSCTCCLKPNGCTSKNYLCSGPDDYCVNKFDGDCPRGFDKVIDACFNKTSDCDCCKSLECTSIGDSCTGRGEYCLGSPFLACKEGYISTKDCMKAVLVNGAYKTKKCTCCKPQKEHECGPYCSSKLKTFECVCMVPGMPCLDGRCYNGFSVDLCGPDSCTCCKEKIPSGSKSQAQKKTAE